jgi:thiamine-phosphate pyrophosphorylase
MAQLFLYAPKDLTLDQVVACATAACAAGSCASIIVHNNATKDDIVALQALGLAVLIADVEPREVSHRKADGLHLSKTEHNLLDLRMSLPKDAMIGLNCGTSRHAAMEAAEQGADYVAFHQKSQTSGEPLVQWWNELSEIPGVPFDMATAEEAMILAKYADFIRPSDDMWQSPEMAKHCVEALGNALK